MMKLVLTLCVLACCPVMLASPPVTKIEQATVRIHEASPVKPLHPELFGVNVSVGDKPHIANADFINKVKQQGYRSFRFPNGCQADLYNWKKPAAAEVTVDEFLDFCDAVNGEAYYTVNMQGGIDNLEVPIPADVSLDERIRYRHTAPNPCGYTNYYFGTLAESLEFFQKYTIQRALDGKRPILAYEMGNENWGQAFTDWTPDVYGKTVEVWAKALRDALKRAQADHPKIAGLKLHITAVGFPVMGNNMKLVDTPDRKTNGAWTDEMNRLYKAGLIDAVQEHFYPYGYANGATLAWTAHNMQNILHARTGVKNPRLKGYVDEGLKYDLPMEFTEWNIKCWGPGFSTAHQFANAGFESGLESWISEGDVQVDSGDTRRGKSAVRLTATKPKEAALIRQVIDIPAGLFSTLAAVWMKTDKPEAALLTLRAADGAQKGKLVGRYKPANKDMWERTLVSGVPPKDCTKLELTISTVGPSTAVIDEILLYTTDVERGHHAISAVTYEQALFAVDATMQMAKAEALRAHLHHLAGDYPCGSMSSAREIKDLGQAFAFMSGQYGDRLLETEISSPVFTYASPANPWATDFNALAPNSRKIPMLEVIASQDNKHAYLWLLNRSSDRTLRVAVESDFPLATESRTRTMSGIDIELPGVIVNEGTVRTGRKFTIDISPYSVVLVSSVIQ